MREGGRKREKWRGGEGGGEGGKEGEKKKGGGKGTALQRCVGLSLAALESRPCPPPRANGQMTWVSWTLSRVFTMKGEIWKRMRVSFPRSLSQPLSPVPVPSSSFVRRPLLRVTCQPPTKNQLQVSRPSTGTGLVKPVRAQDLRDQESFFLLLLLLPSFPYLGAYLGSNCPLKALRLGK